MKLSNINKKIVLSIVLVIAVNAFAFACLWLINMKVRQMNGKISTAKSEISLKEKESNEAKILKASLLDFSPLEEKLNDVFIEQKDVLSFIEEIEVLAKESGVDMEFRSVDISKNDTGEKPVFQFKALGSFSDIFYYLTLLENIKYQIVFDNISLQEKGVVGIGDNSRVIWEANFSLRLLSYN